MTSNATNEPSLKLSVGGKYVTIVDLEQRDALRLSGVPGSDTGGVVLLKSSQRLNIEKVEFKFKEEAGIQGMDWETVIPLPFKVALIDSPKTVYQKPGKKGKGEMAGKPFMYQVRLFFAPKLKQDKWGDIYLTTDLKDKKEIKFSGMLEGKK